MAVKLSYFKLLAKGVAPMFCLEVGEMEWEAVVVDFPEWAAMKATGVCPFGQLPILETPDAGCMSQSGAICQYVGRKKNLLGANEREKVVSDMLCGLAEDFYNDMSRYQNTVLVKGKPAADTEKMWATVFPARFACLEKLLGGKDAFSSSGKTVGELSLVAMLHQIVLVKPDALKPTANLNAFYTRVLNLPAIQKVLTGKSPFGEVPAYFVD
ncbi:putative glutathione S-transferase 6 [Diplonema papillatum]|nr:putative glutathione S-transferase 6 [Diplonema papillatum]|eukprot:gene482-713_t